MCLFDYHFGSPTCLPAGRKLFLHEARFLMYLGFEGDDIEISALLLFALQYRTCEVKK